MTNQPGHLRKGGHLTFAMSGDVPATMVCEILSFEPPNLLEHTHAEPGSRMRWELETSATGTVLRLTHHVVNADGAIDNCYVVGLHTSLSRLAPCLAGAPIDWDWAEFVTVQTDYARLGLAPIPTT